MVKCAQINTSHGSWCCVVRCNISFVVPSGDDKSKIARARPCFTCERLGILCIVRFSTTPGEVLELCEMCNGKQTSSPALLHPVYLLRHARPWATVLWPLDNGHGLIKREVHTVGTA